MTSNFDEVLHLWPPKKLTGFSIDNLLSRITIRTVLGGAVVICFCIPTPTKPLNHVRVRASEEAP